MVVIRLSRGGAKKAPFYHIVATDKRNRRDGRFIERLGYFNPVARGQETRLELNKERLEHWISQGAQPSDRVANLIKAFKNDPEAAAKAGASMIERKREQQANAEVAAKKAAEAAKKAAEAEAKEKAKEEAEAAAAKAEEEKKAAKAAPKEEPKAEPAAKAAEEAPKAEAAEKTAEEAPKEKTAQKDEEPK
jgi:small subunit ribosomal protein S16